MNNEWIEWNGGECPVPKGTLVDVRYRDGVEDASCPAMTARYWSDSGRRPMVWVHSESKNDIIAYRLHQPEESPMTIEQLLSKANHHAAKAAKHERKRDELIQQARELVPEGWVIKEKKAGKEPRLKVNPSDQLWWEDPEDMTNPENWEAGDVVECVEEAPYFTKGREYYLAKRSYGKPFYREAGRVVAIDNCGGAYHAPTSSFRWIRRPSSQD